MANLSQKPMRSWDHLPWRKAANTYETYQECACCCLKFWNILELQNPSYIMFLTKWVDKPICASMKPWHSKVVATHWKEGVFQPKNWVWWRWWQLSNRKYLVIVLVIVSYSHCNSHKTYYTLNHSGSFCQGKHICGSNSNGSSFQKQPLPVALVQDSVLLKQHNAVPWLQALCLSQAPAPSLGDGHWESGPIHRWRQNISNRTGYVTLCYIIYIYIYFMCCWTSYPCNVSEVSLGSVTWHRWHVGVPNQRTFCTSSPWINPDVDQWSIINRGIYW